MIVTLSQLPVQVGSTGVVSPFAQKSAAAAELTNELIWLTLN